MADTLVERGGKEQGRMDDVQDKGERGLPVHAYICILCLVLHLHMN